MQGVSSGLFAAPSAVKANTRQHAALEICEKFLFHKIICEHGVIGNFSL